MGAATRDMAKGLCALKSAPDYNDIISGEFIHIGVEEIQLLIFSGAVLIIVVYGLRRWILKVSSVMLI